MLRLYIAILVSQGYMTEDEGKFIIDKFKDRGYERVPSYEKVLAEFKKLKKEYKKQYFKGEKEQTNGNS